jgi:hypothetical protein
MRFSHAGGARGGRGGGGVAGDAAIDQRRGVDRHACRSRCAGRGSWRWSRASGCGKDVSLAKIVADEALAAVERAAAGRRRARRSCSASRRGAAATGRTRSAGVRGRGDARGARGLGVRGGGVGAGGRRRRGCTRGLPADGDAARLGHPGARGRGRGGVRAERRHDDAVRDEVVVDVALYVLAALQGLLEPLARSQDITIAAGRGELLKRGCCWCSTRRRGAGCGSGSRWRRSCGRTSGRCGRCCRGRTKLLGGRGWCC